MSTEHSKRLDRDVGSRIRKYRHDQQLSLSQLAKDAGISKGYLWSLENENTSSRPSADTLYVIAKALGVLMSDLLGRTLTHDMDDAAIPPSLQEFAKQSELPDADIRMLASVQFRGLTPTSAKRWEYIYNAIRHSQQMDIDV